MKRVASCSKMGERRAGAVVVAQFSAFRYCGNLGEEVNQVVSSDLALLFVQEAVDLAAICSIQESGEKDKETRLPIHICGDTLFLFISIRPGQLSYLYSLCMNYPTSSPGLGTFALHFLQISIGCLG